MVHHVGRSRFPGLVVATVGVLVLAAGSTAAAQSQAAVDPDFARLQEQLRQGDKVTVTDLQGRSVKGRFGGVSAEQITVLVNGAPRAFPAETVRQVKRQRMGMMLGAMIGAGAGAGLAIFFSALNENEGGYDAAMMGAVALGLGAGIGIDALVNLPRTVYERDSARVAIVPLVGPSRIGGGLAVRF